MIQFEQFTLANGLKVIVHEDHATPMAVVNVMYDVGARDENPSKTGFAHLFEHLMFGGSVNIPSYDEPLQRAGGENNAYTTNDITNYYCQLPAENIETAFWLESDRMLSLAFDEKSLEVQRKVVCEEFKEHYLNKPYGDAWHKMRSLAFTTHPYRWMTIGAALSHIENATLDDVKRFFFKHYRPVNAILTVAGHVTASQVEQLARKWFEEIPSGDKYVRQLPQEPVQLAARKQEVHAEVPVDALYKCWHICARNDNRYYATDLLTEILGGGGSSRLFQALVKEKQLFSQIGCYHFGSLDAGLLTIEGKLAEGVNMLAAEAAIEAELQKIIDAPVNEKELRKVKNKTESLITFEDLSLTNRAGSLSLCSLMGDTNLINEELGRFQQVGASDLRDEAAVIFDTNNSSTLYYFGNHKN